MIFKLFIMLVILALIYYYALLFYQIAVNGKEPFNTKIEFSKTFIPFYYLIKNKNN